MKYIGRYEVQAELGRGAFGEVFRAYDPILDGFVAIKKLTAGTEPDLVRRFRNEAAAARKLRHRNIVIVHDFGEQDGSPYLVMELLDGEDLDRLIDSRRALPLLEKLDLILQVAAGLHHAHSNGVVHRDVKPANIMLLGDGTVKIMDFGIALLTQATAARETPKGAILGTFSYMAPEHFLLGATSDVLTDIFAYGVTSYKLLTGTHPFPAVEVGQLVHGITSKTPAPIRALSPECPEALEEAISRLLAKDRDLRYQSLEDVKFDLEPIIIELRKERVGALLGEARSLLLDGNLAAALSVIRKALEIEPGNRIARELREGLQRQIRDRDIRPRITALVDEGREQMQARQFDAAIQKFESALRLDKSNPELHALMDRARSAWQNAQHAVRLATEARELLGNGDLTAARKSIAEALAKDPENLQAEDLRAGIDARIEAREREHRLQDGLNQAKGLMLLQSFDRATDSLTALRAEFPDSTEIGELLEKAIAEQHAQTLRHRLWAGTECAKTLLRNGDFEKALTQLEQLQADFPESADLRDLSMYAAEELRAKKQAQAIATTTTEARRLIEAQKFDEALALLHGAVADYPGEHVLRELIQTAASEKAQREYKLAVEYTLAEAGTLVSEQRFKEALETIGAFVRAYGDSVKLVPLRRDAQEGIEEQRRVATIGKLVRDAQGLLDDGLTEDATQVLQQGTLQFGSDPELVRMLGVAHDELEQQRKAEAISKIVMGAESLGRAREFNRALEVLDDNLQHYPGAERLLRCRDAMLASQAANERELQRAEVSTVGEQPRVLIGQGRFESVTEILEPVTLRDPAEEAVTELMSRAEAAHVDQPRAAEVAVKLEEEPRLQPIAEVRDASTTSEPLGGASRNRGRFLGTASLAAAAAAITVVIWFARSHSALSVENRAAPPTPVVQTPSLRAPSPSESVPRKDGSAPVNQPKQEVKNDRPSIVPPGERNKPPTAKPLPNPPELLGTAAKSGLDTAILQRPAPATQPPAGLPMVPPSPIPLIPAPKGPDAKNAAPPPDGPKVAESATNATPTRTQPNLSPTLAQAVDANQKGVELFKRNSTGEAIVNFSEAIRLAPKMAIAYYNRGAAYYRLGRFEQAIADFNQTLTLSPDLQQARDLLKDAREKLNSGTLVLGPGVSPPRTIDFVTPRYTREALKARLEGTVIVEFIVDEKGRPRDFKVVKSLGMGLDEKTIEAVKKSKMAPGMKDGKPVPVLVRVENKFELPK